MKHVASCSFGKDSLATILLALMHSEPLDEVVYCEVMFDDAISGEVPEHRDFIYGRAIPFLERNGIKVVVLRSEMTYIRSFYRILQKGQSAGKLNSWPLCGKCCIQRDCKLPPIRAYMRSLGSGVVQYIGIAYDEQERLTRLEAEKTISLLEKYQKTERDAADICKRAGLYSPAYAFSDRNGCFFCPNAKERELRHDLQIPGGRAVRTFTTHADPVVRKVQAERTAFIRHHGNAGDRIIERCGIGEDSECASHTAQQQVIVHMFSRQKPCGKQEVLLREYYALACGAHMQLILIAHKAGQLIERRGGDQQAGRRLTLAVALGCGETGAIVTHRL